GFFETAEVRDVYHLIRLLDNPYDRFDLACVLNSPLVGGHGGDYGLSMDGLLILFLTADESGMEPFDMIMSGSYPSGMPDGDVSRIERFAAIWRRAQSKVGVMPPHRIVAWVLRESGYWQRAERDSVRRIRNLKKLFSLLDGLQMFDSRSPSSAWRAMAEFIESGVKEDMASVPQEGEDAVRFLTIHAAKGLEFPIVVLARTDAKTGGGNRVLVSLSPEIGGTQMDPSDLLGVKGIRWKLVPSLKLAGLFRLKGFRKASARLAAYFDELVAHEQLKDVLETMRLLYVAMTRARDRLIIAGTVGDRSPAYNTFLGMIAAAIDSLLGEGKGALRRRFESGAEEFDLKDRAGDRIALVRRIVPEIAEDAGGKREIARTAPAAVAGGADDTAKLVPVAAPRTIPLTHLDRFAECPRKYLWDQATEGLRTDAGASSGAVEYGLIFHRAAANWARSRFDDGVLADAIAEAVQLSGAGASVRDRLARELGQLAASEVGRLVRDTDVQLFVERDLSLVVRDRVLRGRPDLVVFDPRVNRVRVIDYKTDSVQSPGERAAAYRLQALGYGLAASRLFANADVDIWLYFSAPCAIYSEFDIDGAEEALTAAVDEFTEAHKTGRFDPRPSPMLCDLCRYPWKDDCL
ncbi:MAG TPA: hypothetical protein ENF73_01385, partial [Proteobacteria bacterium]|nr:hypothetical protein [Pseudomonadota bacterium]